MMPALMPFDKRPRRAGLPSDADRPTGFRAMLCARCASTETAKGPYTMKITAINTIVLREFPNLVWVQAHTDVGLTGLGETCYGAEAVAAQVHETVAPRLLGQDPLRSSHKNHTT